jgi:hypothetical protein
MGHDACPGAAGRFSVLVPVLERGRTEAGPRCFTALVILVLALAFLNREAEKIINANAWQLVVLRLKGE